MGHGGEVIAVEGDVERALRYIVAFETPDAIGHTLGQGNSTTLHTYQNQVVDTLVAFHDLVGDARDDAAQALGIDDFGLIPKLHVLLQEIRRSGPAQDAGSGLSSNVEGINKTPIA
jgi:hypothetical protein